MPALCEELELLYSEAEIRKFAQAATRQERAGYDFSESGRRPKKMRVEEIHDLADKMGFKKIGIAFCFGRKEEAKILPDVNPQRD